VLSDIEVHGFVSQGAIKTIRNNYLVKSKPGSFEITEVGINFTKTVTDRLRLGVQFFGGGFGTGQYLAKVDWFYLDYRVADWLGIRAGRVKLPFGLYNEINDVDAARLPILLPQSTYPVQNRNFLLAQTGVELYGYRVLGGAGALEYRAYAGTILIDPTTTATGISLRTLDLPYVAGGRVMWELPWVQSLRLGGTMQVLRLDTDLQSAMGAASVKVPAVLGMGSIEYAGSIFTLASEYSRWRSKVDSNNDVAFRSQAWADSDRFYVLAAARVFHSFQVGSYYSFFYPNLNPNLPPELRDRSLRQNYQHDVAGTLRFDITPNWLVKLEGHFMKGTAALSGSAALNDRPIANLASRWAVFLIKTTAYF
jgi:hypothetical protein